MSELTMPAAYRLLLLDDEKGPAADLVAFLCIHGCIVHLVEHPDLLEPAAKAFSPDIVAIRDRLGGAISTDVLRRLRVWTDLPCVILAGESNNLESIVNLELGADDQIDLAAPPEAGARPAPGGPSPVAPGPCRRRHL